MPSAEVMRQIPSWGTFVALLATFATAVSFFTRMESEIEAQGSRLDRFVSTAAAEHSDFRTLTLSHESRLGRLEGGLRAPRSDTRRESPALSEIIPIPIDEIERQLIRAREEEPEPIVPGGGQE